MPIYNISLDNVLHTRATSCNHDSVTSITQSVSNPK